MKRLIISMLGLTATVALSGCVQSQVHLSDNFGATVRQDIVAQIADPDHRYPAEPPAANGAVAVLAQERYRTGKTIQPEATISTIGSSSQSGGGSPSPGS